MKPIDHLKKLILKEMTNNYPSFPPSYIPINDFSQIKNKERRELLRIEKFINLFGNGKANIITNAGTRGDTRKVNTCAMGSKRMIGSVQYTKSQMQNGIADIKSSVFGLTVDFELKRIYKNGRDRQSDEQKKYEEQLKGAGGLYKIVHSFEHFYEIYLPLHKEINVKMNGLFS